MFAMVVFASWHAYDPLDQRVKATLMLYACPHVWMVMQADLVKVIANACSNCRVAQDTVRSVEGGIPLILSHCNSDHTSPFLREWGILAVRNICAGNLENQVHRCAGLHH